jgi:signal transduction histidine kinase
MRFSLRSLGDKLIVIATFTLLLCLLLTMLLSWITLKLYVEHQTQKNAHNQLLHFQQAYKSQTLSLIQDLSLQTRSLNQSSSETPPSAQFITQTIQESFAYLTLNDHAMSLDLITSDGSFAIQGNPLSYTDPHSFSPSLLSLLSQAATGKTITALMPSLPTTNTHVNQQHQWYLYILVPTNMNGTYQHSVLLETIPLNALFLQIITQKTAGDAALCIQNHIVVTSTNDILTLLTQHKLSETQFCQSQTPTLLSAEQRKLVLGQPVQASWQDASSPPVTMITIQPLSPLNLDDLRALLIILGTAIFSFALSALIDTFTIGVFLIRPLRQLQSHATTLVTQNADLQITLQHSDELVMLWHAFNQLSDSLSSESQALLEQMGHLLVLNDALMSTLNLDQLLGEFVFRIGSIMKVDAVSLLLYGDANQMPWAVAQWSPDHTKPHERGKILVYTDPEGDIAMAATTKICALPTAKPTAPRGKRSLLRSTKLSQTTPSQHIPPTQQSQQYTHHSRIPQQALRDIDLYLGLMALQHQKIVYGEDFAQIYQKHQDNWARIALDYGYHAAIAVPLIFREHAIGSFILYTTLPHKVSSRDTFLLSTASLHTSMAIQNALLYAEGQEKNAALERANQLKSQFLANVTHELRTPLHSIISYGALILEGFVDGELTPEQEKHLQFIVKRAEDLSLLVNDMLDLSKIEADRIEVKLEPLVIQDCLTDVVNQLNPLAQAKGLDLHLKVETNLPLALADSHRLRQIAINLISNAIKFTEHGSVTVQCTALYNRDMLCISVTDTGIGIIPSAMDYIFEAFRQADGSTTRHFGGTGLGLTIAKKLIELQGGEITVESIPNEGSTFSFTLPSTTRAP